MISHIKEELSPWLEHMIQIVQEVNSLLCTKMHHTLMDNMLNLGKLNWITMKLTGSSRIESLLGFSDADSKWLKQNRQKVIDYCMSRQHSTDPLVLRGLLNATGIPAMDDENAPALLGVWLGYQMVNQYMKNHKSMTTEQLALKDNMADVLAAFNYKTE